MTPYGFCVLAGALTGYAAQAHVMEERCEPGAAHASLRARASRSSSKQPMTSPARARAHVARASRQVRVGSAGIAGLACARHGPPARAPALGIGDIHVDIQHDLRTVRVVLCWAWVDGRVRDDRRRGD